MDLVTERRPGSFSDSVIGFCRRAFLFDSDSGLEWVKSSDWTILYVDCDKGNILAHVACHCTVI